MTSGLFDLNLVNSEDETASLDGSLSSFGVKTPAAAVCMELWHACAGPLCSLPKKGSAAVYFPQGHLERRRELPAVTYDLPSHVFCRVVDVELQADANSDEVYALVSLVPDQQIEQKWRDGVIEIQAAEDDDADGIVNPTTPHMFCKTLTTSDTSTHGGFSVPRRAAEDCFPPLDYKQQRPSQEIVAKDLHGVEWKFRHIYRGQPRRHLLTSGWSAFVNNKKLVSGDAVLFLRGGDGELRLGVRRAGQVKSGATVLATDIRHFSSSSILEVANAISMRSIFSIFYNPRARSSDIIIPYHKFRKGVTHPLLSGMRFHDMDDSSNRSGVVISVSDADPIRWPGSKWKCLLVKWDDSEENSHSRVSPWEIESFGSVLGPASSVLQVTKRSRISFHETETDLPVPVPREFVDPARFQKVLQGQEVVGFRTPFTVLKSPTWPQTHDTQSFPGPFFSRTRTGSEWPFESTAMLNGFFQCQKISQGQETLSNPPYGRILRANQVPESNSTTAINEVPVRNRGIYWPTTHILPTLLPSSSLSSQQSNSLPRRFMPSLSSNQEKLRSNNISRPFFSEKYASACNKSCRLFGFSLADENISASRGENQTAPASAFSHESILSSFKAKL